MRKSACVWLTSAVIDGCPEPSYIWKALPRPQEGRWGPSVGSKGGASDLQVCSGPTLVSVAPTRQLPRAWREHINPRAETHKFLQMYLGTSLDNTQIYIQAESSRTELRVSSTHVTGPLAWPPDGRSQAACVGNL